MKNWKEDIEYFLHKKCYWLLLCLTGLFGYGYLVTHATVGIDDTPWYLYFRQGLSASVGRWVIFLLGKVLRIADFAPFLTDLAGVLLLMAGAFAFSVLMHHLWKETVPFYGYLFFACFLVASPIWAEVFVYFLHNGVGLGYLLLALSLCVFCHSCEEKKKAGYVISALLLWVSIGCYESMMVAWLVGFFVILLAGQYMGRKQRIILTGVKGAGVMVAAMALRTVWLPVMKAVFSLDKITDISYTRSITEMADWVGDASQRADFVMAIKRAFVMYGVFAFAYLPVLLFVLSAFVMMVAGICHSIRKKEGWTVLLTVGMLVSCFLLMPIEGKVTLYRSAQFLPLVCGAGVLLFTRILEIHLQRWENRGAVRKDQASAIKEKRMLPKLLRGLAVVILSIFLFNQCADLNRWFYMDDMKYQAARETAGQVAYELKKGFDLSKPVVFTGIYEIPPAIIQDAYVSYGSRTFYCMDAVSGIVDPHILEKFYRPQGVWVVQAPMLSVIEWGRTAFGNNKEIANFFELHGWFMVPCMDQETIEWAQQYAVDKELPRFPQEGSILDMGDYVLVNF